jgi:Flp pilus assembly protein TadD
MLQEADDLLLRAAEIGELRHVVLNNLGILRRMQGRYQDAIGALTECIECDPSSAVAFNNLALVHICVGNVVAADIALRRALQIDPGLMCASANLERLTRLRREGGPVLVPIPEPADMFPAGFS